MKLAEALIKRADLVKKYNDLKFRIGKNATVQDGENPSEDPEILIVQAVSIIGELERYIVAINKTNSSVRMGDMTISDAIALRDSYKMTADFYRSIAEYGMIGTSRYSRSEIKMVSVVDVSKFQKLADDFSAKFRELDTELQAMNWNTDLIEV